MDLSPSGRRPTRSEVRLPGTEFWRVPTLRHTAVAATNLRIVDYRPSFDEICTNKPSGSLRFTVEPPVFA